QQSRRRRSFQSCLRALATRSARASSLHWRDRAATSPACRPNRPIWPASAGANQPSLFRRAAEYVDKILRGSKPNDLPVEQPTKFDFIINLTTAKILGL